MKATPFEYRYRFAIHALLFALAFAVFALPITPASSPLGPDSFGLTSKSSWLVLSTTLSRQGWLSFTNASFAVLIFVLLFTALGAAFRTWGSAYVGASVVQSGSMHGEHLVADGPFRHTRNPLYLGTLCHTIGIALLTPPVGAVFLIASIWIFQFRLALAEEPFLAARFGAPYTSYMARVPRFLPMPTPQVPASGAHPHWLLAIAGEIYFIGVFVTLAIFGSGFNPMPIRQGILVSLGLWIIMLALMPSVPKPRLQDEGANLNA